MEVTIGSRSRGRENNFDFIRFVAAVLVIYSHAFPVAAGDNAGEVLKDITKSEWSFGALSVAVFFIVSGFLIAQSYDRSNSFIKYVKSRVLRIMPAFIVVIFLSAFVLGPLFTTLSLNDYFHNSGTYTYLKNIFMFPLHWDLPGVFTGNPYGSAVNGSLWTIPYEIVCYIGVGLLGLLKLLKHKKVILSLFIVLLLITLFCKDAIPSISLLGMPVFNFFDLGLYFVAGMVFYTYRDSIPINKHLAMISIAGMAFCVWRQEYHASVAVFVAYLVMYVAFNPSIKLHRFSKYGDFSYGIYIYAFPVQQAITTLAGGKMSPYLNFVEAFFITLALAVFSWHVVEKRCLSLKNVEVIRAIENRFNFSLNGVRKRADVIGQGWTSIIDSISVRFNWKAFIVLVVAVMIAVPVYNNATTFTVTFPYQENSKSEVEFSGGWLAQGDTEDYRWISRSGTVDMKKAKWARHLIIEGYVPGDFEEVRSVEIRIAGKSVYKQNLKTNKYIYADVSLTKIGSFLGENKIRFRIKFTGVHKSTTTEAEPGERSGIITKITIK
jgi:peptidoglycan/LPS O-acetylase OafA/YrhL